MEARRQRVYDTHSVPAPKKNQQAAKPQAHQEFTTDDEFLNKLTPGDANIDINYDDYILEDYMNAEADGAGRVHKKGPPSRRP